MATKLDKDLVRETNSLIDDKEIIITLTKNQEISLKLKGVRKKPKIIPIKTLYEELNGINPKEPTSKSEKKDMNTNISLYDLRSHNLISELDLNTKLKFEQIIVNLLKAPK